MPVFAGYAERCTAEPGSFNTLSLGRSRVCSASLRKRYVLRCAREKLKCLRAARWFRAYRVTTTVVPTLTRSNRSTMSWLYMRMQP
jgi:hypothetical protein